MAAAGLPVPPGVVLTSAFFDPWFERLASTAEWAALEAAPAARWPEHCEALKNRCAALPFASRQRDALAALHLALDTDALDTGFLPGGSARFAVRSSSPDEDLAMASFAGGYETRLGVRFAGLENAIRACFESSLDARVMVYKRRHGFPAFRPRIAVIVQRQIASEIAGVGFSINPLDNDHDEAVIDANWGLGESVVAGLVTPDHFVVDKLDKTLISSITGTKRSSVWLDPEQGTVTREGTRSAERTLDDTRLAELVALLIRIERLEDHPVDIEWAIADDRIHLLQVRPITTYVPLPESMMTEAGERRRLYADIALSGGFAINAPISPLGLDFMEEQLGHLARWAFGDLGLDLESDQRLWFMEGGRMYQDLSNVLWLASPERLAKGTEPSDALMAATLASIDSSRYKSASRPPWARLRMLRFLPRTLWKLRGAIANTLSALLTPERALHRYRRDVAEFEAEIARARDDDRSFAEFRRHYGGRVIDHLTRVAMPILGAGLIGLGLIGRIAGRRAGVDPTLAERLTRGFEGNRIVEMGMASHALAARLSGDDREDLPRLAARIEQRTMPDAFLGAWDDFLARFGHRGPLEMDLASPRYRDDPIRALEQIVAMPIGDPDFDPTRAHAAQVAARRQAFESIAERSGWIRRKILEYFYNLADRFAGTRETPKHHNLMFYQAVRARALAEGMRQVDTGRLERPDDVFFLTFDELERAAADPDFAMRDRAAGRRETHARLTRQVRTFPAVIDSRGRILRPPRDESASGRPGEWIGMPISPGVVRGPVKVLRDPREKRVEKGDILVAYTTDPGWTPLFANAAAVVLEVGGVLQHGAVVAREYGKPCVAGIDRLLDKLEDGQIVEVDGGAGVVRRVDGP